MDIYTIELYNFLRTVTIKSSFLADQVKAQTMLNNNLSYLPDEENPYYLNMCGLYSRFDSPIYVDSIDTGESVVFNKDLYINHPKTAERYKLPNDQFDIFCNNNPTKKHLIESIVYPVNSLETAISSLDFTVLTYDSSLLQSNEKSSLIQCMYDTINTVKNTLYIKDFLYADTYPVILWDFLWKYLYMQLYAQRIRNVKTSNVHISHIWYYLTSKGLSDYRSILTLEQQYWLYKNIDYLLRNKGKVSNIKLLSENLLKNYNVELKQKSILLNYKDGIETPSPLVEVISEDVYSGTTPTQNIGLVYETLPTILSREYNNGLRDSYDLNVEEQTKMFFARTTSTYHPSRVIEINKKALWLEYESLYVRFILHNYMYRYKEGDLSFKIQITLPGINVLKTLTIGETMALLSYCCYMQISRDPIHLPINIPTKMHIDTVFVKGCNPQNISMNFNGLTYTNVEQYLDELITIQQYSGYISPYDLMASLEEKFGILYRTSLRQRASSDKFIYEVIEAVYDPYVLQGKMDVTFVEDYTTYEEWFNSNEDFKALVDGIKNTSSTELETFMLSVVEKMFPTNLHYNIIKSDVILNEKYDKLKKLFITLCSYSVAFLDTKESDSLHITTSPIVIDSLNSVRNDTVLPYKTTMDVFTYSSLDIETPDSRDITSKEILTNISSGVYIEKETTEEFSDTTSLNITFVRNDLQMIVSSSDTTNTFFDISTMNTIDIIGGL